MLRNCEPKNKEKRICRPSHMRCDTNLTWVSGIINIIMWLPAAAETRKEFNHQIDFWPKKIHLNERRKQEIHTHPPPFTSHTQPVSDTTTQSRASHRQRSIGIGKIKCPVCSIIIVIRFVSACSVCIRQRITTISRLHRCRFVYGNRNMYLPNQANTNQFAKYT